MQYLILYEEVQRSDIIIIIECTTICSSSSLVLAGRLQLTPSSILIFFMISIGTLPSARELLSVYS